MDLAQVVADLVLAQGEEVLTALRGEGGVGRLHCRVEAAHRGEAGERLHRRVDRQAIGAAQGDAALGEGEGVGHGHLRRADRVDPAGPAEDLVARHQVLAGGGGGGGEAGHAQPVHRVLDGEVARLAGGEEGHLHRHLVALVGLGRVDAPAHFQARGAGADEGHSAGHGEQQEQRGGQELDLAEAGPQQQQGAGDPGGGPAPAGGHQALDRVPGTGIPWAMPSMISSTEAPRICASGRRIMRCVSTGRSMALTSSGVA